MSLAETEEHSKDGIWGKKHRPNWCYIRVTMIVRRTNLLQEEQVE